MANHRTFRAWQGARELVVQLYRIAPRIWHPTRGAMIYQIQRASLSVQLNIAEGYALGTTPQFVRHLTIAYASAIETIEIASLLEELCEEENEALRSMSMQAKRNCALVLALRHRMVARMQRRRE